MKQIGRKFDKIVNALVDRAKGKDDEAKDLRRRLRELLKGQDPLKKKSYWPIIGLPKDSEHQYAGPNPFKDLRPSDFENLHNLLIGCGFRLGPPPATEPLDAAALGTWLDVASAAIGRLELVQPDAPTLPDPEWRVVDRSSAVKEVLDRLKAATAVAITGMPGIGKSILARQVIARLLEDGHHVLDFDARRWLAPALSNARQPTPEDYVALCRDLLSRLADASTRHSLPRRLHKTFGSRLTQLRTTWYPEHADTAAPKGKRPHSTFFDAFDQDSEWPDFAKAVAKYGRQLSNLALLADVAAALTLGLGHVIVVIDDVWNFIAAEPVIKPLFHHRDGGPAADRPKLLVTSQEPASLGFLGSWELIKIDDPADPSFDPDFSYRTVAAFAVKGERALTKPIADQLIEEFRHKHIDQKEDVRNLIDALIAKVGAHPLALAAVACAWRDEDKDYRAQFWERASRVIEDQPDQILIIDPNMPHGETIDRRHDNILAALSFAWSLLDGPTRERYLDLAIAPPDQPLNEELFHFLWERIDRANSPLRPTMAGAKRPLRLFSEKSLTRPTPDRSGHELHHLHRKMITTKLALRGEQALPERHRDLLKVTGFLNDADQFILDEARRFKLMPGTRTVLRPDLGENADEHEISDHGRYLLRNLPHHVRATLPAHQTEHGLTPLLTSFRFLQACLDMTSQDLSATSPRSGNVECVLAAFQGVLTKPLVQLARTLRIAAQPLAHDRLQLAAQLLARVSSGRYPEHDHLRAGAVAWLPVGSFHPRFPSLSNREAPLVSVLPLGGDGLQWVRARLGRPTILTDPDLTAQIDGGEWIELHDTPPRILSWSKNQLSVWDPTAQAELKLPMVRLFQELTGSKDAPIGDGQGLDESSEEFPIATLDAVHSITTIMSGLDASIRGAKWIVEPSRRRSALFFWTGYQVFTWNCLPTSPPELIASTRRSILSVQFVSFPTAGRLLLIQLRGGDSAILQLPINA